MHIITYRDEEAEMHGQTCYVSGTAIYAIAADNGLNSDIGGVDGWECDYARLVRFELCEGVSLTREQVRLIVGDDGLIAMEERAVNYVAERIHDYL